MNIPKKYSGYWAACFLLLGACCPYPLYAQGNKAINTNNAISISLIPEIGFNYSYYHLTSKSYRRNFRITTNLGDMRSFYWSLGLQFELWNEWRATLTLGETYNGGDRVSKFSEFSNLPENAHFPKGDHLQYGFPAALFILNFSKALWRFKMGAIKGVALGSELDVLFGAGVLWINGRVYKRERLFRTRPNSNAWETVSIAKYVANPEHLSVGIVNIGLSYRLYINNKARFIFKALYSYGLQGTYLMDYTSRYSFENFINNTKESSVEDFQAETGRHQFTLSIAYPIALYRNKAKKKYLKKEATP